MCFAPDPPKIPAPKPPAVIKRPEPTAERARAPKPVANRRRNASLGLGQLRQNLKPSSGLNIPS